MRNKKADQKQFLKEAISIAEKYGAKKSEEDRFNYALSTIFGKMYISIHEDNSYCYGVFMRFEKLDLHLFGEFFPLSEVNRYSFKWNILTTEADFALTEFEERLSNLVYANKVIRIADAQKISVSKVMEIPEKEINEMFLEMLKPELKDRADKCSYL